jgi:hypothetical protein
MSGEEGTGAMTSLPSGEGRGGVSREARSRPSGAPPTAGGKPLRGLPHPSPPLREGNAATRAEATV